MEVSALVQAVNDLSDEQESASLVVNFLNDAIAEINTRTDAGFPFLSAMDTTDTPKFPEEWQRTLLIPYAVGRVKQRDSSQFEYSDAYQQFLQALDEFKTRYSIPEQHRRLKEDQDIMLPNGLYVTEWGDTLYKLAQSHGATVQEIRSMNGSFRFDTGGSYESDIYDNPPLPWFGW